MISKVTATEAAPQLITISNRKWDDSYVLVRSKEELNEFAFRYIKENLQADHGNYKYYKDVANESLKDIPANVQLSEEEVAALPEHLQDQVKRERARYETDQAEYKRWLRLIEYMETAVAEDDRERCWAMIRKAIELDWHCEGDRISLENFRSIDSFAS